MNDNELAVAYVQRLANAEFWGDITLKLQRGQIVQIVTEERLKPSETLPGSRRNYDGQHQC